MFYDQANIRIKSGNGGNGLVSLRHNRETALGGPDGGNGGNGGNVFFVADSNINTLVSFVRERQFKASDGQSGGKNDRFGKKGESVYLRVPVGTIIIDGKTNEVIIDLTKEGEEFLIAKGGRGGFGNAHFKSSRRQTPDFAELGEPGKELNIKMELKLIADVGIIGLPNAGKSTLISVISASKPKIADYPFTTIVPNLGVVKVGEFSFVACDIPGLIEGSGEGKGLGDEFLRHVERCRILVHLLDPTNDNLANDYKTINNELKVYSKELAKKAQIVAVNKIDTMETLSEKQKAKIKKEIGAKELFYISAVSGVGKEDLLYAIVKKLKRIPKKKVVEDKVMIYRPHENFLVNIKIEKTKDGFSVSGKKLEEIVAKTDFKHAVGQARLENVFKSSKLNAKLAKAGAKDGAFIKIGTRIGKYTKGTVKVLQ